MRSGGEEKQIAQFSDNSGSFQEGKIEWREAGNYAENKSCLCVNKVCLLMLDYNNNIKCFLVLQVLYFTCESAWGIFFIKI